MPDVSPAATLLFLRDEELRQGLELLYYAHRDLAADAEAILDQHGLGTGHHRVLHFIARDKQITVGDLTAILGITKQSLSRLVAPLAKQGLLTQRAGLRDRRQRHFALTEAGAALERQLWELQRAHIARAYRATGPQAVEAFRTVLVRLINAPEDRQRFERPGTAGGR